MKNCYNRVWEYTQSRPYEIRNGVGWGRNGNLSSSQNMRLV